EPDRLAVVRRVAGGLRRHGRPGGDEARTHTDSREHRVRAASGRRGAGNHAAPGRRKGRRVTRGRLATARGVAALALLIALASCHEGPPIEPEVLAPTEVMDFGPLYSANCAGCHGRNGHGGAALGLADPVYLAIAGDPAIRTAIARG